MYVHIIIIYIYKNLPQSQSTSFISLPGFHLRHEQKIRKLDLAKTVAEEKEKQLREAA